MDLLGLQVPVRPGIGILKMRVGGGKESRCQTEGATESVGADLFVNDSGKVELFLYGEANLYFRSLVV